MALLRDIPGNRAIRASDIARAHWNHNWNHGTTPSGVMTSGVEYVITSVALVLTAAQLGNYAAFLHASAYAEQTILSLRLRTTSPSNVVTTSEVAKTYINNPAHRSLSGQGFGALTETGSWTFAVVLMRSGGTAAQFDGNDSAAIRVIQIMGGAGA